MEERESKLIMKEVVPDFVIDVFDDRSMQKIHEFVDWGLWSGKVV